MSEAVTSTEYRRKLAAYVGPGGWTCPCCRPATRKQREKEYRAAKRSERMSSKAAAWAAVEAARPWSEARW